MDHLLKELLTELMTGGKASLPMTITALTVLALHEIIGEYVKAAWFWAFPLENHQAELERLKGELTAERAEHDETRQRAEQAIARAARAEALLQERGTSASQKVA